MLFGSTASARHGAQNIFTLLLVLNSWSMGMNLSCALRGTIVFISAIGFSATAFGQAQTSVGVGFDYNEGEYGESTTSRTWSIPVLIKHESGPVTLKLNVPYVRSSGVAAAGGDRRIDRRETQTGLGDVTASGFYNVYGTAKIGVDLGVKAKFATADRDKALLTTGENDYSVQADVYTALTDTTSLFGTLGWTRKGDPSGTDFRNPLYASLGFSNKLSDRNSWGASYDFRQKVTSNGDPISEATLFAVHKYSKQLKIQGYAVVGFSDASPDFGGGMLMIYTYSH